MQETILREVNENSLHQRENLSPFSFRFSPCMTTCWGSTLFGSWVCHCPPWPWWRSLVISGHVTVTLLETCSSSQPRYLQMTTSSVKQNQVRTGINMEIGSLEWSKKSYCRNFFARMIQKKHTQKKLWCGLKVIVAKKVILQPKTTVFITFWAKIIRA